MSNRTSLVDYWDYVFVDLGDRRTNHWPLLGSPLPGLAILGLYLYFVLSWGPKFMTNRKPFNLNKVLVVYNAVQVYISVWLFLEATTLCWCHKYSFRCEPVDWSVSPTSVRIAWGFYMYFLAKLTELLDTIFFVLRKKESQVSFLHLYHHTTMPMVAWGAAKYYPGGHGFFIGLVNSFVHIIMYSYYMVSAFGPKYQKYLWWKKYITTMQLVQFCMAFLHSVQLLFIDCGYPKWTVLIISPNAIFFYYLFMDFYRKAYGHSIEKNQKAVTNSTKTIKAE